MSVTAYLVVHPQGLLLFDSGVIPDEQIKPEGTTVARATANKTLVAQLAEIGYKPSDINYLVLSHGHYDHTANANEFAGATWIAQKAERDVMFGENAPPRTYAPATFSALKNSKTKVVDGDYDVFGDGTVMLILTPGHTAGHQCLYVKLAKTGPVVLTAIYTTTQWSERLRISTHTAARLLSRKLLPARNWKHFYGKRRDALDGTRYHSDRNIEEVAR